MSRSPLPFFVFGRFFCAKGLSPCPSDETSGSGTAVDPSDVYQSTMRSIEMLKYLVPSFYILTTMVIKRSIIKRVMKNSFGTGSIRLLLHKSSLSLSESPPLLEKKKGFKCPQRATNGVIRLPKKRTPVTSNPLERGTIVVEKSWRNGQKQRQL